MFRKSIAVISVICMATILSGCGQDGKEAKSSEPAPVINSKISKQVKDACKENRVISMVGITVKNGYGSRTNKIIVACSDGSVGEVSIP